MCMCEFAEKSGTERESGIKHESGTMHSNAPQLCVFK